MDILKIEGLPVDEEGRVGIQMSMLARGPLQVTDKSVYIEDKSGIRYDFFISKAEVEDLYNHREQLEA